MTGTVESRRLKDLLKLFGSLHNAYEQLVTLAQSKIDAMRRADISAMRELTEQEQALAGRLQEREGFRRQLMDVIGEDVGLPSHRARMLTVSQLASRLPEPQRVGLLHAAETLRDAASRVSRVNRVAAAISRDVLHHMKWVFASVRPRGDGPVGYSGNGALVSPAAMRIFETVG